MFLVIIDIDEVESLLISHETRLDKFKKKIVMILLLWILLTLLPPPLNLAKSLKHLNPLLTLLLVLTLLVLQYGFGS